jgi:rod shape determining protein RodA
MVRNDFHTYNQRENSVDWVIILSLLLLGFIGLFIISTTSVTLFWQQFVYFVVGAVILYIFSLLDPILFWWIAPFGYIGSIIFIALAYLGVPIRGAMRWVSIGGIQLQPSELVKPFLILAFARLLTMYPARQLRYFLLHAIVFIIPFFLVLRQPDLGTALVYGASWITMMVASGLSLPLIGLFTIMLVGVFPVLWNHLAQFQRNRILTFLDPGLDPKGAGYNALQAMIAVGSGQIFGRGLGRGTQSHLRFLPEYHTDFIFATLVEELGLIGGLLLLFLYGLLAWRLIRPYTKGNIGDRFVFFYTTGLFFLLLSQVFINSGMNMGIIPVTGITLPLVSYGGSSILSLAIAFGILLALRKKNSVVYDS